MNTNIKRLIVIGSFIIFNYILPNYLFDIGYESNWLFVVLKLLSVISIPIFFYNSHKMVKMVNYFALSYLLFELCFLVLGLSATYEINNAILGLRFLIVTFVAFFFAFVAHSLKTVHFFRTSSIVPLILLIILSLWRRIRELRHIGYDIGYYIRIEVEPEILDNIQSRENIFFLYTVVAYIFLEMIFYENSKINMN